MMFYDGDGCFTRWYYDAISHAKDEGGNSLIINKFMESNTFKIMLYERYSELVCSVFSKNALNAIWDDYCDLVEGEISSQTNRFGFPKNMQRWQADMDSVRVFFTKRAYAFHKEMQEMLVCNPSMLQDINVYPNPNNGIFDIHIASEVCAILPMEIFDMTGRLVYIDDFFLRPGDNVITVNTSLPSGLYLMNIGNVIKRIVIQ